ncbi:hypothetical protein [Microbacterium aurum]|uniref:hypothetical protein n=1 Tax=Microbacterium aurum TaxID=36805 RepID=UPI0012F529F2|nr:hypothetical protein [Microbacterium aurum]MBM7826933.1 hypothetical protein [Microbacterium aurum]
MFAVDERDRDRVFALMQEARSINEAVIERSEEAGEPQAAARRYFTDRGVTCEVKLTTSPTGELATWETLTDQVREYARTNAPLPMAGEVRD